MAVSPTFQICCGIFVDTNYALPWQSGRVWVIFKDMIKHVKLENVVWRNICLANGDNFSKVTGWKWIFLSDVPEGKEYYTGIFLFCMQKAARDFPPPTCDFLIGSMPQALLIIPLIFLEVVLQNKYGKVTFVVFIEVFSPYSSRGKL